MPSKLRSPSFNGGNSKQQKLDLGGGLQRCACRGGEATEFRAEEELIRARLNKQSVEW